MTGGEISLLSGRVVNDKNAGAGIRIAHLDARVQLLRQRLNNSGPKSGLSSWCLPYAIVCYR